MPYTNQEYKEHFKFLFEYDKERTLTEEREDAWLDGFKEGKAAGIAESKVEFMKTLIENKTISVDEAAKMLNMTVNEFTK